MSAGAVPALTSRTLLLFALLLGSVSTVSAQDEEPIGLIVADLRGSITPFGQSEELALNRGFDPSAAPRIGLGVQAGVHLYPLRWRVITFGIGASVHTSVGDQRPSELDPDGPILRKKFTTLSPQMSFNFGSRNGWSYLSGGVGTSRLSLFSLDQAEPQARRVNTINYGGGARWFVKEHLAFSLDLRFYATSPLEQTDTEPSSPRMTVMVLSIGASFK